MCNTPDARMLRPSSLSVVTNSALARRIVHPVRLLESAIQNSPEDLYDGRGAMMSSLCELLASADCARVMIDRVSTEYGARCLSTARSAQASYNRLNRAIHNLNKTWVRVRRDAERVSGNRIAQCVFSGARSIPDSGCRLIVKLMGPYKVPEAFGRHMRGVVYLVQRSVFRATSGWGWGSDVSETLLPGRRRGGSAVEYTPGDEGQSG